MPSKFHFQNPVCLTFCAVTWWIFEVRRKVRWVLESTSPGLLKNGKILLCTSCGSRENNQNKVRTQLWDTLYLIITTSLCQVIRVLWMLWYLERYLYFNTAMSGHHHESMYWGDCHIMCKWHMGSIMLYKKGDVRSTYAAHWQP